MDRLLIWDVVRPVEIVGDSLLYLFELLGHWRRLCTSWGCLVTGGSCSMVGWNTNLGCCETS